MIPAGLVAALSAWATGNDDRITEIRIKRDALVAAFLGGPDASTTLTSGALNGKNFTAVITLSREDKLTLFTEVLTKLGEIDDVPSVTYPNFRCLQR